jgi:DNA-binding CsgD family transcriptional regulator/PAS domain-containing protein
MVQAVEAIYAAAATPRLWPDALQAIADCFGDVGALMIYQRDDGSFGTIVAPALATAQADYERQEWWRHDIRFSRSIERGVLSGKDSVTDRHLATAEEIETHPFYARFLAAHGLKWFAGTSISPDPRVGVALAVQRVQTKPPFNEEELDLLTRIARHLENALRLGIRLIDAELASVALSDALDRLGTGVFMLDAAQRILFANAAGKRLIGDALLTANERLRARFPSQTDALRGAISKAIEVGAGAEDPKPVLVHGLDPESFLALYMLPVRLPSEHPADRMLAGARVLVVALASRPDDPTDPAIVRDLLGLTLGEARLASLVSAGLPPRESAQKLGISEETARTVLKRVFAKVGVSRQSELATLLGKLVLR